MDEIIYLTILIATLGLGLLTYVDRLFGIIGLFIGLIGGLYLLNSGTLITNRVYDATNAVWISYPVSGNELYIMALLLGLSGVANAFILITRTGFR